METMLCKVLDIPGVKNFRDIGGYYTNNGKIVQTGRFYRAAALCGMLPAGRDTLLKLGATCIIDLRSTFERKTAPDSIEKGKEFSYHHIPMLDHIRSNLATEDISLFPKSLEEMYISLLENDGDSFCKAFDLFSENSFMAYVFHCTAGKDRTGLLAMLLLSFAGVKDETITLDYSYTERFWPPTPIGKLPQFLFAAKPQTMAAALLHIKEKYGDAKAYLSHIGVSAEKQRKVLAKLIGE